MVKKDDSIKYLRDVHQPAHHAGKAGDVKVVGKDITLHAARFLARGHDPYAKVVEKPAASKQVKAASATT